MGSSVSNYIVAHGDWHDIAADAIREDRIQAALQTIFDNDSSNYIVRSGRLHLSRKAVDTIDQLVASMEHGTSRTNMAKQLRTLVTELLGVERAAVVYANIVPPIRIGDD